MESQQNSNSVAVEDVIRSLNIAIEQKDHYTRGHSIRVAHYAVELAKKIEVPEQDIEYIYRAAMLHDIGQIAIEESVLHKPGKLDDGELAQMQKHPEIAVKILEPMNFPSEMIDIIRHHHEWWNGHGYPLGLARTHIPLGARILAVADAFDAMTSERPHRAKMGIPMALNRLEDGANRQWDPDLVSAWLKLERAILEKEPAEFKPVYLWDHFKA
jgi:putative nucleotidyltransferase with HDIG domain